MASPRQVLSALADSATHHTTTELGCTIAWQQWTSSATQGAPLLLVHGGFGSWTHWAANIEALSDHRAVWTLDLPGLGSSGDMPQPWTIPHFAQLVLAGWHRLLGTDQTFEVAGFSFGAMIAGRVAQSAAEQCTRCTLIGASGFGELHRQVDLLPPPGEGEDENLAASIHRENLARLMLHDPVAIDELAVHIHADNLVRHRFRSRRLAGTSDLAETLPGILAPLVGIWGEFDTTAGGLANIRARRELFTQAQRGAQFHLLPGVGHWAMYEAPDEVNRLLLGSA